MHLRSLRTSVVPKAQHEPQLDWSRMRLMTNSHSGHAVRASNSAGKSSATSIDSSRGGKLILQSGSTMVPIKLLISLSEAPSNLSFTPATQLELRLEFTVSMCLERSKGYSSARSSRISKSEQSCIFLQDFSGSTKLTCSSWLVKCS